MKKAAAFAVLAAVLAWAAPDTGAEAAKVIKLRLKDRGHENWRLSCNTARHMVRERGYGQVKVKSCLNMVYSFRAMKNGRAYIVYVDSRSGEVWRG